MRFDCARWTMVVVGLAVLAPAASRRSLGQEARPTAAEILARVNSTYAQAQSYLDTGQLTTVLTNKKDERQAVEKPFHTAYVRPNRFFFEFLENASSPDIQQRFVIWTEQGLENAHRWWTLKPQVQTGRLDMWLAGSKTLSGDASLAIPQLLMPDLGSKPPRITERKQPSRAADAMIEGVACYVIQDLGPAADESVTLWIGQADFLVRQLIHKSSNGEFRIEETLSFRPQLNVSIPEDATRFTPPAR